MTNAGTVFDIGYQRYTDRREGRGEVVVEQGKTQRAGKSRE